VPLEPRIGIADGELVDLLNRAAVMVYAPRLEPFGFAPLEAGACALPVVAVPEGGVRETVFDGVNGLLVEPEPGALAEAMQRVLQDSALARRLGRQGRELVVQRWSLPGAIDRLEGRLLGAAGQAPPPPAGGIVRPALAHPGHISP
jgi:glycosyltransferase involved in cell wall biosynthesis